MKTLKLTLLACALIVFAGRAAHPQTPAAERRVGDAGGGYSFAVPEGFDVQQSAEGFGLVNAARTVVVAVKAHNFETFEKFMARANLREDGFTPLGEVQNVGNSGKAFRVYKPTPQGNLVVDTCVMFSPFGGGVFVSSFADDASQEQGFQTGLKIANSVRFSRPETPGADAEWEAALRGKHLIYLYTANGFSERKDIQLCPSGQFFYKSESSSASNVGSGFVTSRLDGRWSVSALGGATLTLRATDGTVLEFKVSRRAGSSHVYLNNNRYIAETVQGCP